MIFNINPETDAYKQVSDILRAFGYCGEPVVMKLYIDDESFYTLAFKTEENDDYSFIEDWWKGESQIGIEWTCDLYTMCEAEQTRVDEIESGKIGAKQYTKYEIKLPLFSDGENE